MDIASYPRPWVRFWARLLDMSLYSLILTFAFPSLADFPIVWPMTHSHFMFMWQNLISQFAAWGLISLFFYIIFESLLLSTLGTTLGKWLFKINITPKLNILTALKRTFLVYFRGFAFFIPIISIITLIYAYAALSSSGSTSWDKECNITVAHNRIGFLRILGFIVLFIILLNFKTSEMGMTMENMTLQQRVMFACGIRG